MYQLELANLINLHDFRYEGPGIFDPPTNALWVWHEGFHK